MFVCSSVQLHVYCMHPIVHLSIRSYILIYSFERPFVGLVFICSAVRPFVSKIVYMPELFFRLPVHSIVCLFAFGCSLWIVRSPVQSYNYLFINFSIPSFIYSTYILHTVCLLYYRFSYFNYIIHIYIIQMCVYQRQRLAGSGVFIGFQNWAKFLLITSAHTKGGEPKFSKFVLWWQKISPKEQGPMPPKYVTSCLHPWRFLTTRRTCGLPLHPMPQTIKFPEVIHWK